MQFERIVQLQLVDLDYVSIHRVVELNVWRSNASTCQLTQVWDRSRISVSTRVYLSICLYFCMRFRKPCIHMQTRRQSRHPRIKQSKDSFHSFILFQQYIDILLVFFFTQAHTHIHIPAQTTYNAISCAQFICCCFCFLHFSLFFCSFFGFIRSETNGWVFSLLHTQTHAYVRRTGYTYMGMQRKPSNIIICVNVRKWKHSFKFAAVTTAIAAGLPVDSYFLLRFNRHHIQCKRFSTLARK